MRQYLADNTSSDSLSQGKFEVRRRPENDWLVETLTSTRSLLVLSALGLINLAWGLKNAILYSGDLQWSGARLLVQHRDPWATFLSGDPRHQIIMSQVPNYLHELYILLAPLGLLTFAQAKPIWAAVNLALLLIAAWNAARLCELGRRETWALLALASMSTAFRTTVDSGTSEAISLIALALWAAVRSERSRGLLLGVAYQKYTVPPCLVVFVLLRKRWKLLTYSLIPPLLGFVLAEEWLNTNYKTLMLEPFYTAARNQKVGFSLGIANIHALAHLALAGAPSTAITTILPYLLAILLACVVALLLARHDANTDGRITFACLLSGSLLCFPHLIYDFTVLMFRLLWRLNPVRQGHAM